MEKKIITKNCQYCGKVIRSLSEKQADYNVKAHEIVCKKNPDNNTKVKGGIRQDDRKEKSDKRSATSTTSKREGNC